MQPVLLRCPVKRLKHLLSFLLKAAIFVATIYYVITYVNQDTFSKMQRVFKECCTNFISSEVIVIGINHNALPLNSKAKYIFIVPKRSDGTTCGEQNTDICHGVQYLVEILNQHSHLDGATCHGLDAKESNLQKQIIRSCRFETKYWTLRINETPEAFESRTHVLALCNIVEGPFVIRRHLFDELGFRPSHGETTLLDFFLRSNGSLKVGATTNCSFLEEQMVSDRGAMSNKEIYLDYGLLGFHHNILRVVRDYSITWTQCTKHSFLCPDKPLKELYEHRDKLFKELFPICCSERLDQYLLDTVHALEGINLAYRLCAGTVLGAVRTKTIIPWTYDIDICIRTTDYKNSKIFSQLEKILSAKRYSSPLVFNLRRVMPMFPLTKKISIHSLDNDILYHDEILKLMGYVLPLDKPKWSSMGYVDVYPMDKMFQTGTSKIIINGKSYITCGDPHSYLLETFGDSYNHVDRSGKSKDPSFPWLFWKWRASLTQEDFPIGVLSDDILACCVIVIGITLVVSLMLKYCHNCACRKWHSKYPWL